MARSSGQSGSYREWEAEQRRQQRASHSLVSPASCSEPEITELMRQGAQRTKTKKLARVRFSGQSCAKSATAYTPGLLDGRVVTAQLAGSVAQTHEASSGLRPVNGHNGSPWRLTRLRMDLIAIYVYTLPTFEP
jgi:hypothetical protein